MAVTPKRPSGTRGTSTKLGKSGRQERIVAELKVDAALRVSDLAERFAVTTETIRRDLDSLAARGLIARTYGGAASARSGEPSFNERDRHRVAERRRVAECAVSLVEPGDVVIGISCSGNSANVLNAMDVARQRGANTIGFSGDDGGRLKDIVDLCICVPSPRIEQQEDVHLILEHSICAAVRDELTRQYTLITSPPVALTLLPE